MDMNIITSVSNGKVKQVRLLKNKSARMESGLFAAEGYKVVMDALRAQQSFQHVFIDASKADRYGDVVEQMGQAGVPILWVTESVMKAMSRTQSPQGIVALMDMQYQAFNLSVLAENRLVVVLDHVADPGNLGTIIRTCDAVGVEALILGNQCVDIYNDKVLRASMGSVFNISCYISDHLTDDVCDMVQAGWQVGCGHLRGEDFFERNSADHVALVIGNEANGVSDVVASSCSDLWKLPMRGGAESLNAAIAAGIMLYDLARKGNGVYI